MEKGEFQLEHPVSIKTMEENWGINIVRSLNSQSNIPSTQKQESSDNAEILDTNGNEKCHIEPIDVTLFLSESIECVQETNFNINTVNCGINTRQSLNSNARSRRKYYRYTVESLVNRNTRGPSKCVILSGIRFT